jgi:hypothetical protein
MGRLVHRLYAPQESLKLLLSVFPLFLTLVIIPNEAVMELVGSAYVR